METKHRYITIKEAADLLGVTPTTLRNWDKSGKLTAWRDPMNRYRLYSVEEVSKILQEKSAVYHIDTSIISSTAAISQLPLFYISSTLNGTTLDARALRLLIRQMSRAFRDSMGGGLLERFEEISKLLYCKLYDERIAKSSSNYKSSFYRLPDEPLDETYLRITQLYQNALNLLPDVFTNGYLELSEDKKAVGHIVEILQDINLSDTPTDVKGTVYEELVRNTFEKSENQQFFTPRTVVNFMVQFVDPLLSQNICDPCCGSGGFLIEAASYIGYKFRQQTHKDLPLDELSEYLANHLIGLEIDRRMAWVAQMNLMMHGDGQGNIHHLRDGGSLAFSDYLDSLIPPNSLDLILTNPPFGSDFSDSKHLSRYTLGRGKSSRRRGILFIERCIGWLKLTGRLGIIIDDSVLNGISNKDVRTFILQQCLVEAVISLPEVTFMPYATAKASILFLRKRTNFDEAQPPIFMANVQQVGRKPNGDPLFANQRDRNGEPLLLNELPDIIEAWQTYQVRGEKSVANLSPKIFICSPDRLLSNSNESRLDVQFHHPSRKIAEDILQHSIYPTPKLAELVIVRNVTAIPASQDPDEIWRYIGLANITAGTGEYTTSEIIGSEIKSAVRSFRPGDILFSKLRPELRKCVLISENEDEGVASSECLVFCTLENARHDLSLQSLVYERHSRHNWQVDGEYLAFLLRSDIIFGQLVYQITGVGRPRVSQSAILGLQIPLPPLSIQREVVAAYKMAWQHYLECRQRSETALREGESVLTAAYTHAKEKLCPQ